MCNPKQPIETSAYIAKLEKENARIKEIEAYAVAQF